MVVWFSRATPLFFARHSKLMHGAVCQPVQIANMGCILPPLRSRRVAPDLPSKTGAARTALIDDSVPITPGAPRYAVRPMQLFCGGECWSCTYRVLRQQIYSLPRYYLRNNSPFITFLPRLIIFIPLHKLVKLNTCLQSIVFYVFPAFYFTGGHFKRFPY